MKEAGFKDVRTSINTRQNTVAQYIATQPLLDLSEGTTQIGGARVADGVGQRLVGGGGKPGEGMEELGTTSADNKQGGGRQESVGEFF